MTLCGLCVDNGAGYTITIDTGAGSTGPVPICWPCLSERIDTVRHDMGVVGHGAEQDKVSLGDITGFAVTTAPPPPF